MTKPIVPKHQHWVPQFYLSYFATSDSRGTEMPRAWRYDKETNAFDEKPTSIRNLCGKRYLYSPKNCDGLRDGRTEDFLKQIEDEAAREWKEIAESEVNREDVRLRYLIARFIAALQLRNYSLYSLYSNSIELADKLYPLPKGTIRPDGVNPRDSGAVFVSQLRDGLPKMTETFSARSWFFLEAREDAFIVSDKPVLFIHPSKSVGPGTSDAVAMLPLGPRRVLMMYNKLRFAANTQHWADEHCIRLINREVLRRCHRVIITGRPPNEVKRELGV